MRAVQIEDIKANPNNVLFRPLPENPSLHLLLLAQIAATCARAMAEETIHQVQSRHEVYTPEMRQAVEAWHCAHRKIGEICFILRDDFDVPVFDFCLSRVK